MAHFKLKDLTVNGPGGNGGGIIDSLDEEASGNCILVRAAVEQWNVS